MEGCKVPDPTFSDVKKYPSFAELEVHLFEVTGIVREASDTHELLCVGEQPDLEASGKLTLVHSPSR